MGSSSAERGSPPVKDNSFSPSTQSQKSPWTSVLTEQNTTIQTFVTDVEIVDGVAKATVPDEVLKHFQPLWSNYVVSFFYRRSASHRQSSCHGESDLDLFRQVLES